MDLVKTDYREQLLESIKKLETEGLSDEIEIISKVVENKKYTFGLDCILKKKT